MSNKLVPYMHAFVDLVYYFHRTYELKNEIGTRLGHLMCTLC